MLLEASTDTNPVFAPFLGNNTTGIGGVSGTVALIGSGVTLAKTVAAASGGLQANNTLTGAGLERVLTVGDLPAASVENDAAQIRRTTDYTLTTAFVDVTFDTTDIETDTAVIEHNVATDDIDLKVAGTYQVFIDMQIIADATTGEPDILANARIRVNDTGTGVAGSTASTYSVRDGSIGAGDGQVDLHFSHSFIVTVVEAPDKITLQLSKTEINESAAFLARDITMKVVRLT